MSGAIDAAEAVVFAKLKAGVVGAKVHQHAPDNAPPPLVIVGDLDAAPLGAIDDPDRRVSITVVVITEGQERRPCTMLCAQAEALLDGERGTAGGFVVAFHHRTTSVVLADDGEAYVGTVQIEALALTN